MNIILFRLIAVSILSILSTSCALTSSQTASPSQEAIKKARSLSKSGFYLRAASIYQELAVKEKSPNSDKLLLRAVDLFIKSRDYSQARRAAVDINPLSLSSRERVLYYLLYGKSEIKLGHQRNALEKLDQISPSLLARPEQQLYHILRVKALEGLGRQLESAKERIKLSQFLDEGEEFAHNNKRISKTLREIAPEMLRHQRSTAPHTLRGWIDYILIIQETLTDSAERERYLQRWRDQYPGHAAIYSDLTPRAEDNGLLPLGVVSNVAVILPHNGQYTAASHAIKQGMLTARDEQEGKVAPRIKFYDSSMGNITTIYKQVLDDGAELVIGPLQKQKIKQLLVSTSLETPMLALNQLDGITQNNLYQIGLNPRDEIEQVAALAWEDGYRRALVFVPKTSLGERAARLFSEYWEAIGGVTLEVSSYTSNTKELTKSVSVLLNLDESLARRRQLQSQVGKLEFTPRPRHDADMLFLLAKPTDARIIRPLLSFYRVNYLPVYSTSKVYSGKPEPSQDNDLSGIIFCGEPSKFDQIEQQEQEETASQYQVAVRNIPLLNLGFDTYNMISGLSVLQKDPTQRLQGKTGALWLDKDNNIRRQLTCGQFKDGYVQKIGLGPVLQAEDQATSSLFEEQLQTNEKPHNGHGQYKTLRTEAPSHFKLNSQ